MEIDDFIRGHHGRMSCREMAERLNVSKSTVNRHIAKLRDAGELDAAALEEARARTGAARAEAAAATGGDRIPALRELRDMLRGELGQTGGASMARVASEYRKTLEELEALEREAGKLKRHASEIGPLKIMSIKAKIRREMKGDAPMNDVLDAVIEALQAEGVITIRASRHEGTSDETLRERQDG